jgi:hypothetical protein
MYEAFSMYEEFSTYIKGGGGGGPCPPQPFNQTICNLQHEDLLKLEPTHHTKNVTCLHVSALKNLNCSGVSVWNT